MTHKFEEPNYTQIPNIVFDYWMCKLTPSAFKILLCICRKTFGWHRTTDSISKKQLMECTGLSKNTVQKSIEELEESCLLTKKKHKNKYGDKSNSYTLDVHKPEDKIYSNEENCDQLLTGGGVKQ